MSHLLVNFKMPVHSVMSYSEHDKIAISVYLHNIKNKKVALFQLVNVSLLIVNLTSGLS